MAAAVILVATATQAQKWNQPISFLKGEKNLNIQYTYDGLVVGKDGTEKDYIARKKEDYAKKDPQKAEKFEKGWYEARPSNYFPKFEGLLNKGLGKVGIAAAQNQTGAKYTLVVHTTFIEPGFNVGVMKKPAAANFEMKLVETANPNTTLSSAFVMNVPGSQFSGYDFDATTRISECYAKAAKMIAKTMAKGLK